MSRVRVAQYTLTINPIDRLVEIYIYIPMDMDTLQSISPVYILDILEMTVCLDAFLPYDKILTVELFTIELYDPGIKFL